MNPNLPSHMMCPEEDDEICIDGRGEQYPEHDFPPVGQGDECRRCGAQTDLDDEEAEQERLDRRLRSALLGLKDAVAND